MSEWSDRAKEAAEAKGLVVHWPADNELFVDIDDAESLRVFHESLAILSSANYDLVTGYDVKPSPSGKSNRRHARVRLNRPVKDNFERVMLQVLLGSDRKHEALSWAAATRGVAAVTVFFEKPAEAT